MNLKNMSDYELFTARQEIDAEFKKRGENIPNNQVDKISKNLAKLVSDGKLSINEARIVVDLEPLTGRDIFI